ncbi:MAG: glycoside hydrolase family 3 C-terminal domain-containing protein, partial [Clostridia bacterium]|nr:glycoside hydrolase family 3 C-terminal domain-containing protein [Clostridia bacterium]
LAYGEEISRQIEAEGTILFKNENNVLPLAADSKVSCFSTSSVNLVYGGTGSGTIDTSVADTLKDALEKVGVSVNETLWDFYETGAASEYSSGGTGYLPKKSALYEAPWSVYTDDVLSSVEQYGDAAIVVFSRSGGEEWDLEHQTFNYLALGEDEHELLKNVCQMREDGILSSVIVLINSSNPMEMTFLDTYNIDACMQIGMVGGHGINAVADLLVGNITPSGSLADTWCYEYYSAPAMWNFTSTEYEGAKEAGVPSNADSYMIYQEGIYIGYRYYETRYEDYVMGTGNAGEYDYSSVVAYPFGHGLSYTEFGYSDFSVEYDESSDAFLVNVTITNTGEASGKETVQVYGQSPYTEYDKEHGVEKSAVILCGYEKTEILAPGESENVTISVSKRDLASFDAYGAGTYIMDAGDYYLTAAADAHDAVNQILAAKGYTVENTDGRMTADGEISLTWTWTEDVFDAATYSVSLNGTPITNQLSDADPNLYEGITETVTWLSRSDWMGTFPTERVKLTLTEVLAEDLQHQQYDPADYDSSDYSMPTMGAENGLRLYDMMGKDFDDPDWQLLLDQLSYDDMVTLVSDAFHSRSAVESVQAPFARDENGPSGLNTAFIAEDIAATTFPTENIMASTFNNELVYEVGKVLANNCLMAGLDGLYGPGVNMHRSAYGGRNFEYYSEDPYLAGKMCAYEARGVEDRGVDTLLKHFALNDCEVDRIGLGVWIGEQAAREIYLKAFQTALEEEHPNGIMAAYTRWGATWSGGNEGLITGILREEWGCDGWLISDNVRTDMITAAGGIMAGLTAFDAPLPMILNFGQYSSDPIMITKIREACHYNLYALANSAAMNGIGEDTVIQVTEYFMIPLFRTLSVGFAAFAVFCACRWYRKNKKWTEKQQSNGGETLCTKSEIS